MNDSTIPAPLNAHAAMARAYFAAIRRMAQRRPSLPLDHYAPPVGRCCVPPPAMTEGA